MKRFVFVVLMVLSSLRVFCWGFYAHQRINYYAVFLLPPAMMRFYKPNIEFLFAHAVDPDKRRYLVATEGAHHFIDIDHYGLYPFPALPRKWNDAILKYGADSLATYGIVPWWIQIMEQRLTNAFKEKDKSKILKLSAEIGHYIADAHVPLHACSNHNGQLTNQKGIHAFWESRIPELLAENQWDFFIGKARYISNTAEYIWKRVLQSAAAADTVLQFEKKLSHSFTEIQRFAFEERNGKVIRQFSSEYTIAYNNLLNGMVERRMRESIAAVASLWFTAWVNAGQPDLFNLNDHPINEKTISELQQLDMQWKNGKLTGFDCDN